MNTVSIENKEVHVVASAKQVRSSPQKVRIVANLIRGKKVSYALNILNFSNKKASLLIKKVLYSAISNADHNYGMDVEILFIKSIFVDAGQSMKRMMPRAKGRSDRILKRTSHITIVLSS
ncbi:50S ribosomal protein L22 [Buchnera aphidicola (Kurisakia onigurumii)]|uniref:50S ribosomal protein L22 n=1 Tax=Buchnera aphidicola TaxID=9 RepID=UPI0031B69D55